VVEVDGHDVADLEATLKSGPSSGKPMCLIAHTIKGKGVSFMENQLLWHYRAPAGEEFKKALAELGVQE